MGRARDTLTVRVARGDEGPTLHDLFMESGKWDIAGLDWSTDVGPYWLMAELNGVPWGCLMVRPGRPIGSLEFLCVPTVTPQVQKAKLVKLLLLTGLQSLKESGSQVVAFMLHDGQAGFEKVVKRYGATKWFRGDAWLIRTQ